jgi:hypothetical protein
MQIYANLCKVGLLHVQKPAKSCKNLQKEKPIQEVAEAIEWEAGRQRLPGNYVT